MSEADRLFYEGNALTQAGKYAEACPKFEQSLKLDDGAFGTEFNLADCEEHLNRNASAYHHFERVVQYAKIAGKTQREQAARERMDKLKDKLGWILIKPAQGTTLSSLQIDGQSMALSRKLDIPVDPERLHAVDPGQHQVVAVSTSQRRLEQQVAVAAGQTVPLEAFALTEEERKERDPNRGSTQRMIGYGLGGLGIIGLGVGAGAGIASILNHVSEGDYGCTKSGDTLKCPTEEGVNSTKTARTAGTIADIGFVAGGALLVAGAVVLFTAPKPAKSTTAAQMYVDLKGLHF